MKVVIQRVSRAQISDPSLPNKKIASIGKGMLILAAFEENDTPVSIELLTRKIKSLRIFQDGEGKMNVSGQEVNAEYLLVSQFTLYAECKYGNRPSFDKAAPKLKAKEYYDHFVHSCSRIMGPNLVKHGTFGSDLDVELTNDGPVTISLDSREVL